MPQVKISDYCMKLVRKAKAKANKLGRSKVTQGSVIEEAMIAKHDK